MRKAYKYFILMVLLSVSVVVQGQIKIFDDGELPSDHVYQITQDHDGFIWICTDEGLVKYDGAKVTTFTVKDGLPTNDIWGAEITGDRVWYFTKGNHLGYISDNKVFDYTYANSELASSDYYLSDTLFLARDLEEMSFVGLKYGRLQEYTAGLQIDKSLRKTPLYGEYFSSFLQQSPIDNNDLSVIYKDGDTKNLDNFMTRNQAWSIDTRQFNDYLFLLYCESEIAIVNGKSKKVVYIKADEGLGEKFHANSVRWVNNQLHITYMNNLKILDREFNVVKHHYFDKKYEAHANVLDADGNIWLGSFKTGVHFIHHDYQSAVSESLDKNTREPVLFKDKIYYLQNRAIRQIDRDEAVFSGEHYIYPKYSTSDTLIYSQGWIDHLNIDENAAFSRQEVLNIAYKVVRRNGRYYGLSMFLILAGDELANCVVLDTHTCNNIGLYNDTVLLYGNGGLYYIDSEEKARKHPANIEKPLLCGEQFADKLVLGTNGSGVLVYQDGRVVQQLLPDYIVNDFYNLNDEVLLCATNKGLICFTQKDERLEPYYAYTVNDGLPSNKTTGVTINDSFLYITTKKGITKTTFRKPQDVSVNLNPVYINSLLWNGVKQKTSFTLDKLNSESTTMDVDFGVINYSSYDELKYSYRFTANKEYRIAPEGRFILDNLAIGKHKIELKVERPFVADSVALLEVIVRPRWYETIWLKVLILLLSLALVYWLVKRRENRKHISAINELQKEVVVSTMRLESLRSQMNPHFVFNSLNAIQYYITENQNDLSESYLLKFAKLIREFFDLSNEQDVTVEREVKLLDNYLALEKMRFDDKLNYAIDVDDRLNTMSTRVPCMLIQPLVENAVNHGIFHKEGQGNIEVTFKYINIHTYEIVVSDDGIGIENAKVLKAKSIQGHTSMSSKIFDERIELINKTNIWEIAAVITDAIEDKEYPGTKVQITITRK